jgi:hypothetical protein
LQFLVYKNSQPIGSKAAVQMAGEGLFHVWPSMAYEHVVKEIVAGISSGGGGGRGNHCHMKSRNRNVKASDGR